MPVAFGKCWTNTITGEGPPSDSSKRHEHKAELKTSTLVDKPIIGSVLVSMIGSEREGPPLI